MKRCLIPSVIFSILFLTACSAQPPQVTVTPLPPTETPIPTPTSYPQFTALQEQIAAAGERFALLSDGSVMDGAKPILGIQIDPKGAVTITVDGEQVEIDPSTMNFDDEKGLSIEGFEDTDANGDWQPAQETIDIGGNLSIVLGEKVDGGTLIDSFVADPSLTPDLQVDKLNEVDYTEWGFEAGSLVWMQNSEGKIELVRADDHSRVVGWWERSKVTARTGMVWNAPELVDPATGESIFFTPGVARIWDAGTVYTTELDEMRKTINKIFNGEARDWRLDRGIDTTLPTIRITSEDGNEVVFGLFVMPTSDTESGDGVLFFEGDEVDSNGNREVKEIILSDFDFIQG